MNATTALNSLVTVLNLEPIAPEPFEFETGSANADRMTERVVEAQIAAARCRSIGTPAALAEAERFDANASTFASMAR